MENIKKLLEQLEQLEQTEQTIIIPKPNYLNFYEL